MPHRSALILFAVSAVYVIASSLLLYVLPVTFLLRAALVVGNIFVSVGVGIITGALLALHDHPH